MFNPAAYENSRADGIGVLEVAGSGESDAPRQFVPLKRTELRGEVTGPLAALRLTQIYGYTPEQCDKILEAVYRFPLPGDAAVTGVRVTFGDVEIQATLKEREEAKAEYEAAKQAGRQAALLTRESTSVFTLQVAGLHPGEDVTIETAYVQLARAEGAGWTLRVPLTTAPRYVRSDELPARGAAGQPLLVMRDPGHRFALELVLRGAGAAQSPTHALDVEQNGERLRVRLKEGTVLPDRDFVLSWQPARDVARPALNVLLHDDPAGDVYFLALVIPPAEHDALPGVPREAILLVDHSGSMEGAKWEAADWAVKKFLLDLTERDAFDLGLFHNTTRWFAEQPQKAASARVTDAERFLETHKDSGGTELGVALEQALWLKRTAEESARHVLIITDAQVSDEGRILRLAGEESERPDRRRISVLCIDAAPNSFLALELAERGGGTAHFLTSSAEEEDISTALDEILADWAEPVLTRLRLEVNRPGAAAAGREVRRGAAEGWSAIDLGDLPRGRAVWVAGRVPRGPAPDLEMRLVAGDAPVTARRLDIEAESGQRPALKALFGAGRVRSLEFLVNSGYAGADLRERLARLGYDPDTALQTGQDRRPRVYAENVREDAHAALRALLINEALNYGLASAETAFVAVRTEAGRPVEARVAVANALPTGWSDTFAAGGVPFPVAMSAPPPFPAGMAPPPSPPVPMPFQAAMPSPTAPPPPRSAPGAGGLLRRAASSLFGSASGGAAGPPPAAPAQPDAARAQGARSTVVFSGTPGLANGAAVLFDAAGATGPLAGRLKITQLRVSFPGGTPDPVNLDPGLALLVFVDDLSSPRARVTVRDLVRQGGARPLNLLKQPGQVLRVVLADPAGAWAQGAPSLEVALAWE